jgi:hypothetical protein
MKGGGGFEIACGAGTALSFWRQVSDAIPRKHWGSCLALAGSWAGSAETSQSRATVVGVFDAGLVGEPAELAREARRRWGEDHNGTAGQQHSTYRVQSSTGRTAASWAEQEWPERTLKTEKHGNARREDGYAAPGGNGRSEFQARATPVNLERYVDSVTPPAGAFSIKR